MLRETFLGLKKLVKAGLVQFAGALKSVFDSLGFFPDYGSTLSSFSNQGNRTQLRIFLMEEIKRLRSSSGFPVLGISRRRKIQLFRAVKDFDLFFSAFGQALVSRRNYLNVLNNLSHRSSLVLASRLELAGSTDLPIRDLDKQLRFRSDLRYPFLTQPGILRRSPSRSKSRFRTSIEGKSVLVLGPASSAFSLDGIEVDVLASPKLAVQGWGDVAHEVDFPVLVSYINGETLRRLELGQVGFTRAVDWVRVKDRIALAGFKELMNKGLVQASQLGVAAMPDKLLVNDYGPLMGPAMIYDLLSHRPGVVFVTGFDFYTSLKSYEPSYPSARSDTTDAFWSLRVHEPFSNFVFLQRLWEAGLIEPVGLTQKVLSLTVEQYAEKLEILDSASGSEP